MALINDMKTALRISSDVYDSEVKTLIDAALYDMRRAGVNPELLNKCDTDNGLVKQAVIMWCKANFGYDNQEADRFMSVYDRILNALLNSSDNIAAISEEVGE